jgi:hypothetical protein
MNYTVHTVHEPPTYVALEIGLYSRAVKVFLFGAVDEAYITLETLGSLHTAPHSAHPQH